MEAVTGNKPQPDEVSPKVSPFGDFKALHARLPFYSERALREMVRKGILPSIVLPGGRRRIFDLPAVDAALRRHQTGGQQM